MRMTLTNGRLSPTRDKRTEPVLSVQEDARMMDPPVVLNCSTGHHGPPLDRAIYDNHSDPFWHGQARCGTCGTNYRVRPLEAA